MNLIICFAKRNIMQFLTLNHFFFLNIKKAPNAKTAAPTTTAAMSTGLVDVFGSS